ncbi:MAG: hypothetical protein WC503_04220 [Candidatus Shapirobacteria bacterium]
MKYYVEGFEKVEDARCLKFRVEHKTDPVNYARFAAEEFYEFYDGLLTFPKIIVITTDDYLVIGRYEVFIEFEPTFIARRLDPEDQKEKENEDHTV